MAQALLTPPPHEILSQDIKKLFFDKAERKRALFETLGWENPKKTALIAITYPLTDQNKVGLLQEIMPGLLEQELKLILMGIGTQRYQAYFTKLAEDHADQVAILEERDKETLYEAADMFLCPSDSSEAQRELAQTLHFQVVPISLPQSGVENYDAIQERGNAFLFERTTPWSFFAAVIRALENFRFPYDWKNIQKASLEKNY